MKQFAYVGVGVMTPVQKAIMSSTKRGGEVGGSGDVGAADSEAGFGGVEEAV